ncbi:AI-2E family transporter [Horticoccus luteus]|uniref:AI-2E family transporter n=1 Tax=Horticoccus luteus TaxID=2862869 RepID=A0A8F9XM59_9BACT|nr:AI-2E family transporter [Horticoccus luteus]QYM79916.1 AI-2E family transporter [Horticoccus luteus]
MQPKMDSVPLRGFVTLATVTLVVAILRLAKDVMIPVAMAILLAFLLTPVVVRLTRWGLPKTAAIIATVTLAFAVLGGVGWLVGAQLLDLARQLPNYEQNIHHKIAAMKAPHAPEAISRASGVVENVRKQLQAPSEHVPTDAATAPAEPGPVPVVMKSDGSAVEVAREILAPVLGPLGTAGIVIVFVIAMLFQREDLRDRFLNVVSSGQMNMATQALDDAAQRVSRYLGMQLIVNATYGVPIGLGLFFIGIPNALLWGLLATLLRFIPFLGPWIAAIFPVVLAFAVDPGWMKLIYVVGLFVVMELISNNVVEVVLYGASTGISNVALLVAAVFWTWLWGPAGLFLSTPMTVCLMVIGKYVPGLKFLSVLLGSDPVLAPPVRFYQRMLAMDADEMESIALTYIEERSLLEFYDDILLPALQLAEQDRHHGALAEVRQTFIFEECRELIAELERNPEAEPNTPLAADARGLFAVPARDDADEIVALMLRHLLLQRGIEMDVASITTKPEENIQRIEQEPTRLVFVSSLPPGGFSAAQHVIRRFLRARIRPPIVLGLWSRDAAVGPLKQRLRSSRVEDLVTSLGEAVAVLEKRLAGRTADSTSASVPDAALAPLDLARAAADDVIALVTRDLADAFDVPVSLVSFLKADAEFWAGISGISEENADAPQEPGIESALNDFITVTDDLVVIDDTSADKRVAAHPAVTARGVRFYAGVPLRTEAGHVVGTLCLVDTKPREITAAQKALLRARAAELVAAVQSRKPPAPA